MAALDDVPSAGAREPHRTARERTPACGDTTDAAVAPDAVGDRAEDAASGDRDRCRKTDPQTGEATGARALRVLAQRTRSQGRDPYQGREQQHPNTAHMRYTARDPPEVHVIGIPSSFRSYHKFVYL